MKRLAFLFALASCILCHAQGLQGTPNEFYREELVSEQRAIPYPFLRESDIVWSTTLWKTIDLKEVFNQFFYFPMDTIRSDGRKNLADILWDAMAAGEIPIFEDDELKVPFDNEVFVAAYTRPDTIVLEIGYDDDDNEMYQTIIRPKFFESYEIYQYFLREVWFIGKADTRQDSRRIALAPVKEVMREFGNTGQMINMGRQPVFWVPMQNPLVRDLLASQTAWFVAGNAVGQPSWDFIFASQAYEAFITRESNVYSRSISKYLTGQDAILEAETIEAKVFAIGDDMWEY